MTCCKKKLWVLSREYHFLWNIITIKHELIPNSWVALPNLHVFTSSTKKRLSLLLKLKNRRIHEIASPQISNKTYNPRKLAPTNLNGSTVVDLLTYIWSNFHIYTCVFTLFKKMKWSVRINFFYIMSISTKSVLVKKRVIKMSLVS